MYLITLVIETIAPVIFKEAAERIIKEILKRKSERKTPSIKKYQKNYSIRIKGSY